MGISGSFCEGNTDGKIGGLLAIAIVAVLAIVVVCLYTLCYIQRSRMICQQRLQEATEREVVAYQDVNLLLTFMAYSESHGVKMEPPASTTVDTPADHRKLITDRKLAERRQQILTGVLRFFGYEPTAVHQPPAKDRSLKQSTRKGASSTCGPKKTSITKAEPSGKEKMSSK